MVSIFYLQLIKLEIISKYKFAAKSKHIQNQQKLTNYRLTSEWSMKSARDKLNQRSPQTSVNNSAYKSGKLWYKSYCFRFKTAEKCKILQTSCKTDLLCSKSKHFLFNLFYKDKSGYEKDWGCCEPVSEVQRFKEAKVTEHSHPQQLLLCEQEYESDQQH